MAADPWLPTWEVLGVTEHTVDHDRIDVRHVRMVIADEDDYWSIRSSTGTSPRTACRWR